MRKSIVILGIVFGLIAGYAHAVNKVEIGTLTLPRPSNGTNGCTPDITISEKSGGCYTVTTQKKQLSNGSCVNEGNAISREICDGDVGPAGCGEVYDVSGWGTTGFALAIKWCCGDDSCQEMTNEYPVAGAYTDYYNAWVATYCASVFTTEEITGGYRVFETNPCTGQNIATYDVVGVEGAPGNDADIESVTQTYIPYPESKGTCSGGQCQYPNKQGYMQTTIVYRPSANKANQIMESLDPCDQVTKPDPNNSSQYIDVKICTAQGSSTTYNPPYTVGQEYWFEVSASSGGISHADSLNYANDYPRLEYVKPLLTNGTTGYPMEPGYTHRVYRYQDGHETYEPFRDDSCQKYVRNDNPTVGTLKCQVTAPENTYGATSPYTPESYYCLNVSASDCSTYFTVPLENAIGDANPCVGPNAEDLPNFVQSTKSQYVPHVYVANAITGTVGYKLTVEEMCSGNPRETVQEDPCSRATQSGANPVTCDTGYAWQTCTIQTSAVDGTHSTYSGCFPDTTGGLFAYKDEIVPVNLASDDDHLYYCKITDCNADTTCWVNGVVGGMPDGESDCWGVVSVSGLTGDPGDAGPGCSFVYNNSQWQVCCLPVDDSGNVNVNASWDCKEVTDQTILGQLNNWMCKPTYATKYIDATGNEYNTRNASTIGSKTVVTNCDGTLGTTIYTYDDDPCYGLSNEVAAQTIKGKSSVYVPYNDTNNIFDPGVGYYQNTVTMCYGSPQTTYDKDECVPVADTRTSNPCVGEHQVYKECKRLDNGQTYNICDTITGTSQSYADTHEATGWPRTIYVAPQKNANDTKLIKEGYTAIEHKYLNRNGATTTEVLHEDTCREAVKRTRTATNASTYTTTVETVRKCTVQSPGTTGYTTDSTYCLNTNATGSCDGYVTLDDTQTSKLKYHLPTMSGTTPVKPGYTYWEETDSENAVLREIIDEIDPYEMVIKPGASGAASKTTKRYTVLSPGAMGNYSTGKKYCLGEADGDCTGFVPIETVMDEKEDDPCAGVPSNSLAGTVKKILSHAYTRGTNSQGSMTTTYKMCDDNNKEETISDTCKEVPTPSGQTCDGVWMVCTRQADEGTDSGTAKGTTYEYCAAYPQCSGSNSNSATVIKKTQRSYTAPNGGSGSGDKKYYATPGQIKDEQIACNGSTVVATDEVAEDQCEEIPDSVNDKICPANKPVLKQCTRKGNQGSNNETKAGTTYKLCTTGTSIFGALEGKLDSDVSFGTATNANDNNKEYITMTAGGATTYVVATDNLKPASLFDTWKEQYKEYDDEQCALLFGEGKKCNGPNSNLTEAMMFESFSDYGVWKKEQVDNDNGTLTSSDLTRENYRQQELVPCRGGFEINEDATYQGTDGKRYTMSCIEE